ncbi:unnamed protein product [Cylindrotheca closterium]|uniref:Uncharacterized protein n=1 Tax=Cylindrotheca closterium TaxID=2856 RepID=A0AAD2GEZ3_9STRA|nr:unnamed protein product [Cylindrotheca closterium]
MSISILQAGPAIMYGGLALGLGYGTFVREKEPSWKMPAIISAGFFCFTAFTVYQEGLLGVIPNHTSNYWGNQVWYDLLYSVGLFWFAVVERAKKVGMPLLPWFIYVICTASIGGLHMYARILYLEEEKGLAHKKL